MSALNGGGQPLSAALASTRAMRRLATRAAMAGYLLPDPEPPPLPDPEPPPLPDHEREEMEDGDRSQAAGSTPDGVGDEP
jgi:hypothetical protein